MSEKIKVSIDDLDVSSFISDLEKRYIEPREQRLLKAAEFGVDKLDDSQKLKVKEINKEVEFLTDGIAKVTNLAYIHAMFVAVMDRELNQLKEALVEDGEVVAKNMRISRKKILESLENLDVLKGYYSANVRRYSKVMDMIKKLKLGVESIES